ncbi:S8/S53 family peptidase [Amycolatopsis thermophila]|uniref:Subtilase family protein n=1 Tax=Amycolatopsis thermophila TaxID=206084 RepID=A0ABU0EWJ9_9PSEU|nr:hypothetical protein [Amycolatopsis thermophila]
MRMRAMWPAATPACAGPARAREGQVLEAGTPGSVAGSCLVVLQQTATSRADDLAGRYVAAATRGTRCRGGWTGSTRRARRSARATATPPPRPPSLDDAVRGAIAKGVNSAIPAANEGTDAGNDSPARVTEAITVAASDDLDRLAAFPHYGSVVDLYAPGVDTTPHVAGAAATRTSGAGHPGASPAQVSDALVNAAIPGKISNATAGTPNRLLFAAG